MKKTVLIIGVALLSLTGFAQDSHYDGSEMIMEYTTTDASGEVAITIAESSKSNFLELTSEDEFYRYEILNTESHELIHSSTNTGKFCEIDKGVIEDGSYTLLVYTSESVIDSEIIISKNL